VRVWRHLLAAVVVAFGLGPTLASAGISIVTKSALRSMAGRFHRVELEVEGGTPPYRWSLLGTLPLGLTLDTIQGVLSGTPTMPGSYNFRLSVIDAYGNLADKDFLYLVTAPLLITSPSTLPAGSVGRPYSYTMAATGGMLPYEWFLVSWPGVQGLSLGRDGTLKGTPQTAGTYNIAIKVQDADGYETTGNFELTIAPAPLVITTSSLPSGMVGEYYSVIVGASGGKEPYNWSVQSGSFPPGLQLVSATGEIRGTPGAARTYNFTLSVRDALGTQVSRDFSLSIAEVLAITSACPLPAATVNSAYSVRLQASGGAPGYSWSLESGKLPSGLSLAASTGTISGTPTAAGLSSFTLAVTDSRARRATKQCSLEVALLITPSSLPDATLGRAYGPQRLQAAGGSGEYTWSVSNGSLPPGMDLDSQTGIIGGTPTAGGTYQFAARASDRRLAATGERTFALKVNFPPMPSVNISGLPNPVGPLQQPRISLSLAQPYPAEITGQLSVQFSSEAVTPGEDPGLLFENGKRWVGFSIPAGSTKAAFETGRQEVGLQVGTVAGTVSVAAALYVQGVNLTPAPAPSQSGRITPQAPAITEDLTIERTPEGFKIRITGYSTTRDLLDATFSFSAAAGYNLMTPNHTVSTADAANTYFASYRGGAFVYEQPFRVDNYAGLRTVTVTLRNTRGSSQPRSKSF